VVVQPAQEPSAGHFILNVVNALISGLGAGAVVGPEEKPGDELDDEGEEDDAAPGVAPARAAGDVLVEQRLGEGGDAGAVFEPVEDAVLHVMIYKTFFSAVEATKS